PPRDRAVLERIRSSRRRTRASPRRRAPTACGGTRAHDRRRSSTSRFPPACGEPSRSRRRRAPRYPPRAGPRCPEKRKRKVSSTSVPERNTIHKERRNVLRDTNRRARRASRPPLGDRRLPREKLDGECSVDRVRGGDERRVDRPTVADRLGIPRVDAPHVVARPVLERLRPIDRRSRERGDGQRRRGRRRGRCGEELSPVERRGHCSAQQSVRSHARGSAAACCCASSAEENQLTWVPLRKRNGSFTTAIAPSSIRCASMM